VTREEGATIFECSSWHHLGSCWDFNTMT